MVKEANTAATATAAEIGGVRPGSHRTIPLGQIVPNPEQVRQSWATARDADGKTALDRLAESIRNQGLLSELVVTPQNGHFSIICGERRYRAIKNNNLMAEIPCLVVEGLTPAKQLEMNIVENLQREDLTPVDEANAYKALMEKCSYTQATLAKRLGISGAMVSYKLSLLDLSPGLQKEVAKGRLSETDGRTIAQTVKRISGPQAPQQRVEVQAAIEKELKDAPANPKNGKVDSPTVKRVAEAAVTKVAGAEALPQVRAPKTVSTAAPPRASQPTTPGEEKTLSAVKEQADTVMVALKDVGELLKPSRRALADAQLRKRVTEYLLVQHPLLPAKIRSALNPLDIMFTEATAIINDRAKNKNTSNTPVQGTEGQKTTASQKAKTPDTKSKPQGKADKRK